MLQAPLKGLIDPFEMETALKGFESRYLEVYRQRMLQKLGFEIRLDGVSTTVADELLRRSLTLLWELKSATTISSESYASSFLPTGDRMQRQFSQTRSTRPSNPIPLPKALSNGDSSITKC